MHRLASIAELSTNSQLHWLDFYTIKGLHFDWFVSEVKLFLTI